jgi:hypothetical protein
MSIVGWIREYAAYVLMDTRSIGWNTEVFTHENVYSPSMVCGQVLMSLSRRLKDYTFTP